MPTLLVVDNSPVNIQLVRSTLEPFGYTILAAQSAPDGLELARLSQLDLILSDLHMPGQDGFDFIRAVKADPDLRGIPFIFLSSTVWRDKDRTDGLALGAVRFIIRPIEPQALLRAIDECLKTT